MTELHGSVAGVLQTRRSHVLYLCVPVPVHLPAPASSTAVLSLTSHPGCPGASMRLPLPPLPRTAPCTLFCALLSRLPHTTLPSRPHHTLQVMKPSPSDVVCLTFLLRGAGPAADAKKSQWWKAVSQLATSPNVSADQQRELEHLLLLREHRWVNATAAAAATESDVRRKVERAQAELAEATRLRAAQEEAAAAAAAELQKAEERTKAAAAQLAELQQGAAEAQASADAAARRRVEDERAAATARKQVQEALAEAARTKQAADTHAAMGSSSADSDSGSGTASEAGRHWYCANAVDGAGPWGPHTAAELLGWLYQDVTLAGELQAGGWAGGEGGEWWQLPSGCWQPMHLFALVCQPPFEQPPLCPPAPSLHTPLLCRCGIETRQGVTHPVTLFATPAGY